MSSDTGGSSAADNQSLEQVIDRYLDDLAADRAPYQAEILAAHPELAEALAGVFRTLEFVEATSRSLNATSLSRDQRLGEFRIVREVGRGGMGVVYEAIQTSLDRRVALKVLPVGSLLSGSAAERFRREAATAGRLHHSHIVPVFAVGEDQGIHYYAMQFIEGRSLSEHLATCEAEGATQGVEWTRQVARWGRQAADALESAHRHGTIHRDIKPSNLLLDRQGDVWVSDFGLARTDALASITVSGDLIGTARYMSPEQARGDRTRLDHRTDIYSLGATLYELAARRPAVEGESREEVLNQIVLRDPTLLRRVDPAIPKDLATIVGKCMQKNPERRYQRTRDVADDLRRFLDGEPILARRTSPFVRAARVVRRHKLHAVASVISLVLASTALVLVLELRHTRGRELLDEALGIILVERDMERAARLLDEAEQLGMAVPELHLYRGLMPLLRNQPQLAVPALRRALELDPDHVEVCCALAYAYTASMDAENSQHFLDRVDESEIDSALGWLLRGHVLALLEAGPVVIDCFDRAISRQRDFTPAIEARGQYRGLQLMISGDQRLVEPMLADLNALVVLRSGSVGSYVARALGFWTAAAFQAGLGSEPQVVRARLERSRTDFEHALSLRQHDDTGVLASWGAFLRYVGEYERSAAVLAQAQDIEQQSGRGEQVAWVHQRAVSLHALGDIATALHEVEPVAEAQPALFPVTLHRVILLAEAGRLDDARAAGVAALEHLRLNATGTVLCAAVLALLGEEDAASDALAAWSARIESERPPEVDEGTQAALAYLSGALDPEQLLAAASTPGDRCHFAFLVMLHEFGRGHRTAGRCALDECLATGVMSHLQFRFAQAIAARIENGADWPAWVPTGDPPE